MLQQRLCYDLQSAFLTESREHLPEDLGLYVREDVCECLEGHVEVAEIGFVKAIAGERRRQGCRILRVRRGPSKFLRPNKRSKSHGGALNAAVEDACRAYRAEDRVAQEKP